VLEVVKEAVKQTADLLAEFEAIADTFAGPMAPNEMDALLDARGRVPNPTGARGLDCNICFM